MMGRWMARAGGELTPRPTRSCRCRCIGGGYGRGASTSRRRLPAHIANLRRAGALRGAQARARNAAAGRPVQAERAENVQGAFRVPPERKAEVAGRRLVLIDDVLTSGATVDTCARALLRAGAEHVDVLVFARVVAPVRSPI